ncbi:hypothetical protein SCP_1503330 [Sparassis crispa]|uniref:Uncharacterized protein n=1 Tax=Sparassis crispa TaxID=139825 RepID=A0A401H4F8_9APHY|nr:hypothetical protein SCP_1503330 [Sparassis crispa]GBE89325.1 hypothetical protein SCP_1503330 [Sparassis crispa]
MKSEHQLDFAEVGALVRLAHKYQIADLRENGLAKLKMIFTDDLAVWEEYSDSRDTKFTGIRWIESDAISVVNLVRLTNAMTLLPVAFYLCCQLQPHELTRGVTRPDGTVERLSTEDLEVCIRARAMLMLAYGAGWMDLFSGVSNDCTQGARCMDGLSRIGQAVLLSSTRAQISYHSCLSNPRNVIAARCTDHRLCAACVRFITKKSLDWRRTVWNSLPAYFGLGKWEKLKTAESAAD